MKKRHTPGPWQVIDRKPGPHDPKVINPNMARYWVGTIGSESWGPSTIANVNVDGVRHDGLEIIEPLDCEANARLIAAAPELLVALQDAVRVMRKWTGLPDTSPIIQRLQAVIAKATGEPVARMRVQTSDGSGRGEEP